MELTDIASTVLALTSKIQNDLVSRGDPLPTLDALAPFDWAVTSDLEQSRLALLSALDELQARIMGPSGLIVRMTGSYMNMPTSLQAICRFEIASKLAPGEQVSFAELAQRVGLSEQDATQLIRMAIAYRIFCEPKKGFVAHNALSRAIGTNPQVHHMCATVCDELWPYSPHVIDAVQKWPGSQDPNQTAYNFKTSREYTFVEEIGKYPERIQRFAGAMSFLQSTPEQHLGHLVRNLGWEADVHYTMVDIGGSHGSASIPLLYTFPNLSVTVQDFAAVITGAHIPDDLQGRLQFQAHNMFTEQPIHGADVYFFRCTLHNWSDKYAVAILKALIPAFKPGARLILNEMCLPEPNELPKLQEQQMRGYDLSMKQIYNGRERDADGWATLISSVDEDLRLISIKTPPGSILSIIECRWERHE